MIHLELSAEEADCLIFLAKRKLEGWQRERKEREMRGELMPLYGGFGRAVRKAEAQYVEQMEEED